MADQARRTFIVGTFALVAGLLAGRPVFADDDDDDDDDGARRRRIRRRVSRRRPSTPDRAASRVEYPEWERERDQLDHAAEIEPLDVPRTHPEIERERSVIAEEESGDVSRDAARGHPTKPRVGSSIRNGNVSAIGSTMQPRSNRWTCRARIPRSSGSAA